MSIWRRGRTRPSTAAEPEPGAFTVELRKSGITMTVPQGVSVIDAALARGVDIAQQCRNGVCGTCQTRLVEGEVEHHDMYLEADERERFMMPCVSRAPAGGRIVLDL